MITTQMRLSRRGQRRILDRRCSAGARTSRFVFLLALAIELTSATCGVALAIVNGKTVPIGTAPWTVVVWEKSTDPSVPWYAACDGVIISRSEVLTAGHCVMTGNSASPLPASGVRIEAGVSNFNHPLASERSQFRAAREVRAMPGYIAASKVTHNNEMIYVSHDLALMTLSRPLDLDGDQARAAVLPTHTRAPTSRTRLVIAGFGNERRGNTYDATGVLNQVLGPTVASCSTSSVLCVNATSITCWGDSGSGAVEPGRRPTVVGVLSAGRKACVTNPIYFVSITAPAVLRFIKSTG